MAGYFTVDFLDFFKELAPNNNKEWFDKNRRRYEESVKIPFYKFTDDLINKVQEEDPAVQTTVKESVFRINRDIRFSKDKTPYKMHMSAVVSSGGRKHINSPGLYFEFGAEAIRIYQGAYFIDPAPLNELRSYIIKRMKKFNELISDKQFKKLYGHIIPEPQSRIPKEYKPAAEKLPLLTNKSFYFGAELPPEKILDKNILKIIFDHYKAGKNICHFLSDGLRT